MVRILVAWAWVVATVRTNAALSMDMTANKNQHEPMATPSEKNFHFLHNRRIPHILAICHSTQPKVTSRISSRTAM